ncbi:MAG: 9-O-acetylesterase [Candidatus Hydrogenedentes bacterium]|nr:9-O-acetylesterase [Candidatus Hydrogenedentota bacterium]
MYRKVVRGRRALNLVLLLTIATGLLGSAAYAADLKLPAIFSDHAVLQQKAPVPVWGWGEPGANVTVTVARNSKSATVGPDGRWRVDLAPMKAGGPYELTVASGDRQIVLKDILIGEVWFASGQSNMQWSIKNTDNWEQEVAQCANDKIRIAMIFREVSTTPLDDVRGLTPWAPCTSESMTNCYNGEGFSAVSYYFAKYVQAKLRVPVGIVNTSWGGTRIEPWTPPVGFEGLPSLAGILADIRMNTPNSAEYQAALRDAIAKAEAWIPAAKQALEAGAFPPALPTIASASTLNGSGSPTALYNAMVAPLVPYANRGFIWYQGESNRGEGMLYRDKMEALIKGWRAVWNDDKLACYYVQLAPFNYGNSPQALPEIWEAQSAALGIPGTGMAVINDIANVSDIHPRNKNDVGKRLALLALNKTYGKGVKCEGPTFDRFKVEGNEMRVYFKHARSLKTRDGAAPTWFALCGPDGVYHPANAAIEGSHLVLTANGVSTPVAVRFAWDHIAEPNLLNEADLPASAFRAGAVPVDGPLRAYVPEAHDMQVVYALDPTQAAVSNGNVVYDVDNRKEFEGKTIERIGYLLLLIAQDGSAQWVYTEMDPFTQNVNLIGVPTPEARFQQDLSNLVVKSNIQAVPNGNLSKGAIELWSCNYGPENARGIAGASKEKFDFGDTIAPDASIGYGCLQINDIAAGTTLLAYNNHRGGRDADVGIGNCPGDQPDWTFSKSAQKYASGRLLVVVKVAAGAAAGK